MKTRTRQSSVVWRNQSCEGQSLAEMAISLTFMIILLAGVIDLGRAFFTFNTLQDAAQEGAAYGSLYPTACTQIEESVRNSSNQPINLATDPNIFVDVTIAGVPCVSATPAQACAPNNISVVVRRDNYPIAMPFLGFFLGTQTIDLAASADDAILSDPCSP